MKNKLKVEFTPKERKIALGKELEIRVEIPKEVGKVENLKVLFNKFGENPSIIQELQKTKEEENYETYCTKVQFNKLGEYFFFFLVKIDGREKAIKISRETNEPFITEGESPYWKVLINNDYTVPGWAKGKIVYQIFVDRFNKSSNYVAEQQPERKYRIWGHQVNWGRDENGHFHNNDFFGGNLKGIEEKLDYLESLGVEILYLSPINLSTLRYDRYAATDHMEIDPIVGTFEDLDRLHKKALSKGMYLILDVAFNHCCSDNPIYLDANNNPNSVYSDWFSRDENGNIRFWYGFSDMPEFNLWNQDYQNYVYGENGVIAKYSKYVDGFRLDLAEALPPFFLEGIRTRANKEKARFIVGEYWDDVELKVLGTGLDVPTCYPITNAALKYLAYGESGYLEVKMKELVENYPQETLDSLLFSLDTHDIIRVMTIFAKKQYMRTGIMDIWKIDEQPSPWHKGYNYFDTDGFRSFEYENENLSYEEYQYAKSLLKVGTMLQYFFLGNPCVYYGTESGLYGWKDPFNRKCYNWGYEDQDLISFYQEIGNFRKKFVSTNCNPEVLYKDSDLFIFKRENKENSLYVALNRSEDTRNITVPDEFKNGNDVFALNGTTNYLLPYGGIAILKSNARRD